MLSDSRAVMLFISAFLLFYTALIVPAQICLWSYDDPCDMFPSLPFDVIVDVFFMVTRPQSRPQSRCGHGAITLQSCCSRAA